MGLGTGGSPPPADDVVPELAVLDRDWMLLDMAVDHEMFDMPIQFRTLSHYGIDGDVRQRVQ